MRIFASLLMTILCCTVSTYAAETHDEQSFFAVPILMYSSDTGTGFGAAGIKSYRREQPRVSTARFNTIYTTKKQFISSATVEQYTRNGNDRLCVGLQYKNYPTDFFGIGNDTHNDDPERYTPEYVSCKIFYERQVYRSLKIRPSVMFHRQAVVDSEPGGVFKTRSVPWARGRLDIGPGIGLVWDTRDNTQATASGRFIAFDCYHLMYQDHGDGFTLQSLDMRSFVNPFGGIVLASMVKFRNTSGDVPYYLYSQLGGDDYLRGYENSRFIDKSMFLIQQDLRFPLWWRFGGAVFIAAGQVAPRLSEVFAGTFHIAGGIGGRFYINREDRLQVRADLAFSEDSSGFYIGFGEVF